MSHCNITISLIGAPIVDKVGVSKVVFLKAY